MSAATEVEEGGGGGGGGGEEDKESNDEKSMASSSSSSSSAAAAAAGLGGGRVRAVKGGGGKMRGQREREKRRGGRRGPRRTPMEKQNSLSSALERAEKNKHGDAKWEKMQVQRLRLPAMKERSNVLAKLADDTVDVVLVAGQTGSGKTTQVPQFVLEAACASGRGGLDAECNLICTQPRRIAAVGVAERVAAERAERCGETVGYSIRMESKKSDRTRLMFCTTGVLLRRLQDDPTLAAVSHVFVDEVHERNVNSDFLLAILRQLVLRQRKPGGLREMGRHKPLKVVLMSATMNEQMFADYFAGKGRKVGGGGKGAGAGVGVECPIIRIPGRTFPVDDFYLEDVLKMTEYDPMRDPSEQRSCRQALQRAKDAGAGKREREKSGGGEGGDTASAAAAAGFDPVEQARKAIDGALIPRQRQNQLSCQPPRHYMCYGLIAATVAHILGPLARSNPADADGAVLVFVQGVGEIKRAVDAIRAAVRGQKVWITGLHGSLSSEDQRKVFDRPPKGTRKVVVSTNVAETSITIDDCAFVVDSGRVKETRYDSFSKIGCLVDTWISQASAKQRRGRAGRVRRGKCYKLYSKRRFEECMWPQQLPEMHRVSLEQLCLQIRALDLAPQSSSFLQQCVQPPPARAVSAAVSNLAAIGALRDETKMRSRSGGGGGLEKEKLLPLGKHLANVPCDVRIGKMLIYGCAMGCAADALTLAAAMCS